MIPSVQSLQRWDVLGERRGKRSASSEDVIVFHRVVGINRGSDGIIKCFAILNLTENAKIPDIVAAVALETRLQQGHWVRSAYDPFIPKIRSSDELKGEEKAEALACLHDRLKLVRIVDDAGWDAFVPSMRAALIWRAASKDPCVPFQKGTPLAHSPAWVRKLLHRFWRYGGSGFALLRGTLFNGTTTRAERMKEAEEKGVVCKFTRKTGPKPKRPESSPHVGPEIDPDLYTKMRDALMQVLDDRDLRPALARNFDARRAIPWRLLTDKINEKLLPKTVTWSERGAILQNTPGIKILTRSQVKTMGETFINVGDFVVRVKDWKQVALDHHVPRGDVRDVATWPGQRYEVDIGEADVFGIHDGTLLPIGRMFMVSVVDCFSRMIAAMYPWAGDPDVRMITYGLNAAAMPKSEWGRIIGEPFTDEEWPCQGLPETVTCDNGEAATHGGEHLAELVFDVVPNPPHLAYLKQAVETSFKLGNVGYIDYLPASTKGPRERGAPDRQKEAKITLSLFTRQLNRWACHVANHSHLPRYPEHEEFLREKTKLKPIELWLAGRKLRGGELRPYVRERHLPALLESMIVRIVPQGLDLDGVYYDYHEDERPEWFARLKRAATAGPAHTLRAHYDRMTLNRVYLVPKNPAHPVQEVPLSRLSRQWENYSRKEYDAAQEFRKDQGHAVDHEHKVRKALFGKSVTQEIAQSDQAIKDKYGSTTQRDAVHRALGKEGQILDQTRRDTARDQTMHPTPPAPVQTDPSPQNSPEISYDDLLGLN